MVNKNLPDFSLVSPLEAVKLFHKGRTIEDFDIVEAIYNEYTKHNNVRRYGIVDCLCLYATIWNAGRVQGIREERQRKKPLKQPHLPQLTV